MISNPRASRCRLLLALGAALVLFGLGVGWLVFEAPAPSGARGPGPA